MLNSNNFYQCNGISFRSKVDACIYSDTVKKPVRWVFTQQHYDRHNWRTEPTQTLDELYDMRARELREQYDYVILSYSGGADTNNILESFIRQGLHIDEIVTNHITRATEKFTILDPKNFSASNFAAEHQLQAIPRLQYIHDRLPKTKLTVLDVSDTVLDAIASINDVDWTLHRNDHLSVGQLFRYNYFYFSQLKKQFDKNLRICIITGADKPRTIIQSDGSFNVFFTDTAANIASIDVFNEDYSNVKTELFYWADTTAPLVCKQAHVIKRWLEANPDKQRYWTEGPDQYKFFRLFQERLLRSLLYPTTWDNSWFQSDKSTNWWHTEFDDWFRADTALTRENMLWDRGIEYLAKQAPSYIKYNEKGKPDGLRPIIFGYSLGKLKSPFVQ